MSFSYSAHSADQSDESKPRSRRRAGGKSKKSHPARSKFEQVRSKPRRPEFEDDFEDIGDDDFDEDFDEDLDEDEGLDDFDDDDFDGDFDDDEDR